MQQDDDTYQIIADKLTMEGHIMTRATARHSAMSAFEKFSKAFSKYYSDKGKFNHERIARSPHFQQAICSLLVDDI